MEVRPAFWSASWKPNYRQADVRVNAAQVVMGRPSRHSDSVNLPTLLLGAEMTGRASGGDGRARV
eukprot:15465615-Alexandrium_andersonii.AAC.1